MRSISWHGDPPVSPNGLSLRRTVIFYMSCRISRKGELCLWPSLASCGTGAGRRCANSRPHPCTCGCRSSRCVRRNPGGRVVGRLRRGTLAEVRIRAASRDGIFDGVSGCPTSNGCSQVHCPRVAEFSVAIASLEWKNPCRGPTPIQGGLPHGCLRKADATRYLL